MDALRAAGEFRAAAHSLIVAGFLAVAGLAFMFGAPVIAESVDGDTDLGDNPIGLIVDGAAGWNAAEGGPSWCDNIDAHRAARLGFIAAKLKLTDAQNADWSKFVAAVAHAGQPEQQFCDDIKGTPWPTALPERVARMEQIAEVRITQLEEIRPAIVEFYGILTPAQKAIADGLLAPHRRP